VFEDFQDFDDSYLRYSIIALGQTQSEEKMMKLLKKIESLTLSGEQVPSIISNISTILIYKTPFYSRNLYAMEKKQPHPLSFYAKKIIMEWYGKIDLNEKQRLSFLSDAVQFCPDSFANKLKEKLISVSNNEKFFKDFDADHAYSNALHSLGELSRKELILPLENLCSVLLFSHSNASHGACKMIESYGTKEALELLLDLHPTINEWFLRDAVEMSIEQLSVRLGLNIIRENGELSINSN
jgi:hypothetical protein